MVFKSIQSRSIPWEDPFTKDDLAVMSEMGIQALVGAGRLKGRYTSFSQALWDFKSHADVGMLWAFGHLPLAEFQSGRVFDFPNLRVSDEVRKIGYTRGNISGLSVLDFSAGFGRDTLYLLKQGANVHAIEPAPQAIDFIKYWANVYGERFPSVGQLTWQHAGYRDFDLGGRQFDLVLNIDALNDARDEKTVCDFIRAMQGCTKVGGVHILEVFNSKDPIIKKGFRPEGSMLQDLYSTSSSSGGWKDRGSKQDEPSPWGFDFKTTRHRSIVYAGKTG
ncbi:MAG: class I SAM-dependent methyltransferase [Candidatus Altiarchaeota archaeon]